MSVAGDPASARPAPGLPPRALIVALVALTVVRLVVAAVAGLVDDEAYYRLWSLDLRTGYLDHAPMVAWMIRAGRALVGDTSLGVRLLGPLSTAVGTVLLWRAVALAEGRETATRAAVWFNAMVLIGAGSVLMTPDTPAVFFWGATLWALAELTASRDPRWWLVVGATAGLGLFSKYSVLFLGVGLVAWLVSMRETRRWFAAWQLWAGGALALALFAPVVAWNAAHEWASFAKQFGRTVPKEMRVDTLFELFGVQLLLVGLPMVPFVGLGLRRAWQGWRRGDAMAALPLVSGLPFVAYLAFHSLHGRIEGNWPAPLYPAFAWMAASAVPDLDRFGARARGVLGACARAVAPLGFTLVAALYLHVSLPLVILPPERDPTAQMRGWDAFARDLEAERVRHGLGWIAAPNYTMEGQLAARLGWAAVVPLDEALRYIHLPERVPDPTTAPGLLVVRASRDDEGGPRAHFESVTPLGTLVRGVDGRPIEAYALYRVSGLKPR